MKTDISIRHLALCVATGVVVGIAIIFLLHTREALPANPPTEATGLTIVVKDVSTPSSVSTGSARQSVMPTHLKLKWVPPVPVEKAHFDIRFFNMDRHPSGSVAGDLVKEKDGFMQAVEGQPGTIEIRIWYEWRGRTCEMLAPVWSEACPITSANFGSVSTHYLGEYTILTTATMPPSDAQSETTVWGTGRGGYLEVYLRGFI
ncbi:MAG: hypothetical protein WC787_05300 [Patescibacteria group bacterium]|jgi:hypothetical protein